MAAAHARLIAMVRSGRPAPYSKNLATLPIMPTGLAPGGRKVAYISTVNLEKPCGGELKDFR